jgi:hypothetical protein
MRTREQWIRRIERLATREREANRHPQLQRTEEEPKTGSRGWDVQQGVRREPLEASAGASCAETDPLCKRSSASRVHG